jgi:hypothetical protein
VNGTQAYQLHAKHAHRIAQPTQPERTGHRMQRSLYYIIWFISFHSVNPKYELSLKSEIYTPHIGACQP